MPALNYGKWDGVGDGDSSEEEERKERERVAFEEDEKTAHRQIKDEIDSWLQRQIARLPQQDPAREMEMAPLTPWRRVTRDERQQLAMFMAICQMEQGETNLDRHPQMLEIVRHNRWMEEDPGALEVLCRVHHQVMKDSSNTPESEDARMRELLVSAINTLGAAKRCKFEGGLLQLVTAICTPQCDRDRELRKLYQKKQFAKDTLFDSLFPELKRYKDGGDLSAPPDSGAEMIWLFLLTILMAVAVFAFVGLSYGGNDPLSRMLLRYFPSLGDLQPPNWANATVATTTVAPATATLTTTVVTTSSAAAVADMTATAAKRAAANAAVVAARQAYEAALAAAAEAEAEGGEDGAQRRSDL
eukprot:gnl/TRDRNA2_/TRDRNA2_34199_c0_seq1.p1 gnl/TRDRNA2_/TRDRNA2_34199_c0~~gnl/TRDRNA2_/TRDRNA2_34199_c0_seq1.p1  ORF type:complete len:358 (-),score=77.16 gnl/TRDRNA2_/TRDRNA2_34199_c0_seq1:72-1145(-)